MSCEKTWSILKNQELEIELEFQHNGFAKHAIFSEGASEPKRDAKVILNQVKGQQPHEFLNSNHLLLEVLLFSFIFTYHMIKALGLQPCEVQIPIEISILSFF